MKYSVRRIEMAKQAALGLTAFKIPKNNNKKVEIDWTRDDEIALNSIITELQNAAREAQHPLTHAVLNKAIDFHVFSGGRHYDNAGLANVQQIELENGDVRIVDHRQTEWTNHGISW